VSVRKALDHTGALLIADDVGNTVWQVSMPGAATAESETQ
jgi:hypothetical protein